MAAFLVAATGTTSLATTAESERGNLNVTIRVEGWAN